MQPIEPIPRAVDLTRPAGLACTMGRWEASRLHHAYVGPEHLLLGLLRDAEDPVETEPYPQERGLRGQVGLPDHGPHAIKLLVETRGLTLEMLRAAVLEELDQGPVTPTP